jgi:hypothetical protein
VTREQRHRFWCRMASTLAVQVVMVSAEAVFRTSPDMTGLPILEALIALRSEPHRRLLPILGKGPKQLLDLDQLADKSCRRVRIAVIEEEDRPGGQLASHLSDGCNPDERIVAETERRLPFDTVTADHEAAVPKLMTYSPKRLRERLTQVLADSAR